jgi:elongation factor Ts
MEITAQLVKELRERSGVGMMDCKTALKETNGDLDAALTWLREKGIAKAAKKQSRIAAEGLCSVVENGNTAILFELNSETDFVSKNDSFLHFLSSLTKLFGSKLPANDAEALALTIDGKTVETLISELTFTIGEKISLRRVTKVTKKDDQVFGSYITWWWTYCLLGRCQWQQRGSGKRCGDACCRDQSTICRSITSPCGRS